MVYNAEEEITDPMKINRPYMAHELTDETIIELLQRAVQSLKMGILCFDVESRLIFANKLAFELFHEDQEEKLKEHFLDWIESREIKDLSANWCQEYEYEKTVSLYDVTCQRIFNRNYQVKNIIYIVDDYTPDADVSAGRRYREMHDPLTGILNRNGFYREVEKFLKEHSTSQENYYILISNIRDFKLINRIYGDQKGNSILKNNARILSNMLYPSDIVARFYADKFAAFIPERDFDKPLFQNVINLMQSQMGSGGNKLRIQVGIYKVRPEDKNVAQMCDYATMALNSIHVEDSLTVAYYEPSMLEKAMTEKEIISGFEEAMQAGEFKIYLQPQVDAHSRLLGAEALVRWCKSDNVIVPPNVFIPIFERSDLISKLDRYVWELSAKQLETWKGTEMEGLYISVNISPKDIEYLDVYEIMLDLVEKYEIDTSKLHLEITETVLMSNPVKVNQLIMKLKRLGFLIEIDDFGSGYSSLNLLKDIKADVLKIDMGFLRETMNQERSHIILDAVIYMSKRLGMETVTEGVETENQLHMLTDLGCDMYQGYLFSRPIPVKDFEKKYFMNGGKTCMNDRSVV